MAFRPFGAGRAVKGSATRGGVQRPIFVAIGGDSGSGKATGTVSRLEDLIWDHFDARHHHLRHLASDQFGDYTDGVMRKHHSDPLALVQLLLVHRILSARRSMLLKVPLSVHEEISHAQEQRGEAVHDHQHV